MNDDSFFTPESDNQFVLSYELICLLRWLMDHDSAKLKKMVMHALMSGLKDELERNNPLDDATTLENIQESIIDFFEMFEALLLESTNELAIQKAFEQDLIPAIDQIDSTVCDDATVRSSIEKATSDIDKHPQKNPKELLFKELLRRWKPNKKNALN